MKRSIPLISLVIPDYDEAIDYYCKILGLTLKEDRVLGADKRWVVIGFDGDRGANLLLAKAKNEKETASIGQQTGGRVFLFMHTDDFNRDYQLYLSRGVKFLEQPRYESYGTVVVFQDNYGNKWDLIEPKS